jgi:hypothetical protein
MKESLGIKNQFEKKVTGRMDNKKWDKSRKISKLSFNEIKILKNFMKSKLFLDILKMGKIIKLF